MSNEPSPRLTLFEVGGARLEQLNNYLIDAHMDRSRWFCIKDLTRDGEPRTFYVALADYGELYPWVRYTPRHRRGYHPFQPIPEHWITAGIQTWLFDQLSKLYLAELRRSLHITPITTQWRTK